VPEHRLRIATAYDDLYNLPPERMVSAAERLGFRGVISHYIGMSHYFALTGAGELDQARTFNNAALAWHRDFARAAKARGYKLIWSLSYEILDMFCPAAWKQRAFDGTPALTVWEPPSALVSPANGAAIDFLKTIASELVAISQEAGLQPQVQIGEPWWWVTPNGAICLYDEAGKAAFGGDPVEIANVRGGLSAEQVDLLDLAGEALASSTAAIAGAVKAADANATTLLLAYLPTILDPAAPEVRRANLPLGWARPAFDVLQLEDYEWVTSGRTGLREAAYSAIDERLGYPKSEQHYFSGFVADEADRHNSSNAMTDAPTAGDQSIGTGDGAADRFALAKLYGSGEERRITRPVPGSVRVAVGGVEMTTGWTLGAKGVVQFASPPTAGAAITAGFLFDVPVRFAEDRIEVNRTTFLAGEAPTVPLVEVREDEAP